MIPEAAVEAAVAGVVAAAKAEALEEVATHIAARIDAGDTESPSPQATIAWLRERAEDLRRSIEL